MKENTPEVRSSMTPKFDSVFYVVQEVGNSKGFLSMLTSGDPLAFQKGAKIVLGRFLDPKKKEQWEKLRRFAGNLTYYKITTSREFQKNTELKLFQLNPGILVPNDLCMILLRRTEDLFTSMCEEIRIYMALIKHEKMQEAQDFWTNIFADFASWSNFVLVDEQIYEHMTNPVKVAYNQTKNKLHESFRAFMERFQELVLNIFLDQVNSDYRSMIANKEINFPHVGKKSSTNTEHDPEIICSIT